ncbi:hypothetical protein CALCODRAFT_425330, partial [Calocera cornea HHB12733]
MPKAPPEQQHLQRARLAGFATICAISAAIAYYEKHYLDRQLRHTSIRTGAVWVEELLQAPPSRIRETLGMHKHVFIRLCTMLCTVGGLRPTRFIGVTEQLALFL